MRFSGIVIGVLLLSFGAACGGDDDDSASGSATPFASPTASPDALQVSLSSVLLTAADVPVGLEPSGLSYSYNADVAASQEDLDRLNQLGRLLGVDMSFLPTDSLAEDEPIRGGIQNSASVYTEPEGASQTFQETVTDVRATDWQQQYPDLQEFAIREMDHQVGDESIWLRITGTETCTVQTPVGAPAATPSTVACPDPRLIVDDYVIFRSGRVRSLVKVLSAHPLASSPDIFEDDVAALAQLVVERATVAFPVTG